MLPGMRKAGPVPAAGLVLQVAGWEPRIAAQQGRKEHVTAARGPGRSLGPGRGGLSAWSQGTDHIVFERWRRTGRLPARHWFKACMIQDYLVLSPRVDLEQQRRASSPRSSVRTRVLCLTAGSHAHEQWHLGMAGSCFVGKAMMTFDAPGHLPLGAG